jgi:hypothetical protein
MSLDTSILLKLLADSSSLKILDSIAQSYESGKVDGTTVPISKTSLTRRQYYRRLSTLANIGLIARGKNGKYNITLFGRLIYAQIVCIRKLVDHYWKIQAIDSIKLAIGYDMNSEQQFTELINTLIEDQYVNGLLFSLLSLKKGQANIIATNKNNGN